jgi:hypothetical protein
MPKMDYKKDLKHLYLPTAKDFTIVDVPPMNFLMVDGHGDPNTSAEFQEVCNALYGMAYTLKFALKAEGADFTVAPLEGLWWTPDMADFNQEDKSAWDWTLMIMQPDPVNAEWVEKARAELTRKKNPPALPHLRFEPYHEGLSVQILYFGAYADERPTIVRMHEFIRDNGYAPNGKHHEIYIGDPRRNAPEKLKTVIRQPIKKA